VAIREKIRHQIAIAGRVTDSHTGRAIGGAQIEITAAPAAFTDWLATRARQYGDHWTAMAERPDRTRTARDGHFHFLDLPDGKYTIVASLPGSGTRYGTAQVTARISSETKDGETDITMATADIRLPPTALKGRITDKASGEPVILAEVRMLGSGERTFSDASEKTKGRYVLTGLETGKRTIQVSAQGYKPDSKTVRFEEAGREKKLDFALKK
jgi:hypothetical protein